MADDFRGVAETYLVMIGHISALHLWNWARYLERTLASRMVRMGKFGVPSLPRGASTAGGAISDPRSRERVDLPVLGSTMVASAMAFSTIRRSPESSVKSR